MDLQQEILAHSGWKMRLTNYVNGREEVNVEALGKDDHRELGKWLCGEATKYVGLKAFADLKAKHAKFHSAAAVVARTVQSGLKEKALELLDPLKSEYARASADCVQALMAFDNAIPK